MSNTRKAALPPHTAQLAAFQLDIACQLRLCLLNTVSTLQQQHYHSILLYSNNRDPTHAVHNQVHECDRALIIVSPTSFSMMAVLSSLLRMIGTIFTAYSWPVCFSTHARTVP